MELFLILTDFFTLNVSSGATLVVSYIGFAQQEIPVKDKRDFVIRLAEDSETLNEVVVIGYGSARKKRLDWCSNASKVCAVGK